jgi:hypothetical protein
VRELGRVIARYCRLSGRDLMNWESWARIMVEEDNDDDAGLDCLVVKIVESVIFSGNTTGEANAAVVLLIEEWFTFEDDDVVARELRRRRLNGLANARIPTVCRISISVVVIDR